MAFSVHTFRVSLGSDSSVPMRQVAPRPPRLLKLAREETRACTPCRRRKSDGMTQVGRICSTCARLGKECGYDDEQVRPVAPPKSYVEDLEGRLQRIEQLLRQRYPDIDLARELQAVTLGTHDVPTARNVASNTPGDDSLSDEEDYVAPHLTNDKARDDTKQYFGKSSLASFVRKAAQTRFSMHGGTGNDLLGGSPRLSQRMELWEASPVEQRLLEHEPLQFHPKLPPPATLAALVDAYFRYVNVYCPLLHRDLFKKQLREHSSDERFLAVALLVCACGARLVLCDQPSERPSTATGSDAAPAGWEYFEQVEPLLQTPPMTSPKLYDLQMYILAFLYLSSNTGTFTAPWTILGIGIRVAYQAGAHRARVYQARPNLIDELWKRAFWLLIVYDRHLCVAFGRDSAAPDESFDLDPPLEVDDQYWDVSGAEPYELRQLQPHDLPPALSYFVHHAKMSVLLGTGIQTLKSIHRSRIRVGTVNLGFPGDDWESGVRNKVNAMLEEWAFNTPKHLIWRPTTMSPEWIVNAACLHTSYCYAKIVLHNPFPFMQPRPSSTSAETTAQVGLSRPNFTATQVQAFSICIEAAHAACETFAQQIGLNAEVAIVQVPAAFTSAMVLLAQLWFNRTSARGVSQIPDEKIMAHIRTCTTAIQKLERSWDSAARTGDLLNEISARYGRHAEMPPISSAPVNAQSSPTTSNGFLVDDILRSPAMAFPMPLPELSLPAAAKSTTESIPDCHGAFDGWPPELQALLGSFGGGAANLLPDVGDGVESEINWSSDMY